MIIKISLACFCLAEFYTTLSVKNRKPRQVTSSNNYYFLSCSLLVFVLITCYYFLKIKNWNYIKIKVFMKLV